ncbi:MAG: RAMP superfamily CRISPR-associated protein [Bacillota bacterium]|nr:RAMP superfamily CRISPR-associated protein [Bacillota bacterium]
MTYRVITATLTARTAVHIGSGESNDVTDALVRRDTGGQPFISGTAIAGALRTLLTRLAPRLGQEPCRALSERKEDWRKSCDCAVCRLFGDINPGDEEGSTSAASRLLVFNAHPVDTVPCPLIRDGVGIDRMSGTAARAGAVKFDLEVLPAGAKFELRMELRDATPEDELLLAAGLAEWEAGRLWLGGRVARGLGAFKLDNLQYKTLCLDTPEQVLAFLKSDEPWRQAQPVDGWLQERLIFIKYSTGNGKSQAVARGWLSLTGILQAEGTLLTNDILAAGASGFDHAPLRVQWGDWQKPVLTGAGLRGVLRFHAERLARTLATLQAAGKEDFLRRCPACDPNVRDNDKAKRLPLESCDSLLKKARVTTSAEVSADSLCLACRLFGSPRLGSRLIVEDAPYQPTEKQSRPVLKMLDFLAIDRFTGGGAEGAKFDALALWRPAFALRLHLENPEKWELGWLWLVLRDLSEGWLTVGFGGAKGFGRVKLTSWTATFGYLLPEDAPPGLTQLGLASQKPGVYTTVTATSGMDGWALLVQEWVNAFHETVKQFQRPEQLELTEDSYFGRVDKLYPVKKGGAQ